jgi:PTH1 family peptidyl-tRNA hydrolase
MSVVKNKKFIVVGLGNPGEEYKNTRHNTGAIVVSLVQTILESSFPKVSFLQLDSFMNNSGKALKPLIKSKKDLESLVVIYDDLDLPLGKIKLSFNRSAGGHRGLDSIIKALKTREFWRIRVGISPQTPTGKIKKPNGEKNILNFLLGEFKKDELVKIKKFSKKVSEILNTTFTESPGKAMSLHNN